MTKLEKWKYYIFVVVVAFGVIGVCLNLFFGKALIDGERNPTGILEEQCSRNITSGRCRTEIELRGDFPKRKPGNMKFCFNIGSRSYSSCEAMIKRNMNMIVSKDAGFSLNDFRFRCALADNDNTEGCDDNRKNRLVECLRLKGTIVYKSLPTKQFLSVAKSDLDCYFVFNSDDDLVLLKPFWKLMSVVNAKCMKQCHVGKMWRGSKTKEGSNEDHRWVRTFRTNNYPNYMSGPFLGFSGDLIPVFKLLGDNGLYHNEGNADIYFALLMHAIRAQFVDWGDGWFNHLNEYSKNAGGE